MEPTTCRQDGRLSRGAVLGSSIALRMSATIGWPPIHRSSSLFKPNITRNHACEPERERERERERKRERERERESKGKL